MMPNTGILASSKHVERFKHIAVIFCSLLIGHFGWRDEGRSLLSRSEVHITQFFAEKRADVVESEIESLRTQKAVETFPDRLLRK